MSYLAKQMWVYLGTGMVATAILTFLWGRAYLASTLERAEKNWRTRTRAAEDAANSKLRATKEGYAEELEQNASQLSALTTDLQSQRARVSSLGNEAARWRADYEDLRNEHEGTIARLRTLDDRLAAALEDADQLDLERKRLRGELERRGSELTKAMEETALLASAAGKVPALEDQTADQTAMIQNLTADAKSLQATIAKYEAASKDLRSQLDRSAKTIEQRETRIRELTPLADKLSESQGQIEQVVSEHDAEIARREDEATRLRSRVGELEPMAARVVVLGGQLAEKMAALTSLESQLAALKSFPDRLKESAQELARAREASRELEADLARVRGELERAKRKPKPLITEMSEKTTNGGMHLHDVRDLVKAIDSASASGGAEAHETSDVRKPTHARPSIIAAKPPAKPSISTHIGGSSKSEAPRKLPSARPAAPQVAIVRATNVADRLQTRDDLKRISGIGPKLESRLHGLGYLTYGQIARWSQEDIDRVEHELPGFPDRIKRDDWIGQARQLAAETEIDEVSVHHRS